MALRSFKYFSIVAGGTPQPLVGTKLSAAIVPSAGQVNIAVADSSMFLVGDWAIFDIQGSNEERHLVQAVPDGTHITVDSMASPHAINAYVRLGNQVSAIYAQCKDGNTGAVFIGTAPTMVTATGVSVVKKLVQVAAAANPNEFNEAPNGLANADDIGQLWVDGTTNDQYLPSARVI